jgi:hypothetical protein
MAFGTTTLNDVAKDPGGNAIPYAVVFTYPRNSFFNAASAAAHSAIAGANGVFTLASVECTDEGTTSCPDTFMTDMPFAAYGTSHYGSHHLTVVDPRSGEHVYDCDFVCPSANKPTTIATVSALAV